MTRGLFAVLFAAWVAIAPATALGQQSEGEKLLNAHCSACHERLPDGGMHRISTSRRTPEGWDMTMVRMVMVHGVEMTPEDRATLVKYLADTRGLAPAEVADWRYILERRPNYVEASSDELLTVMCARCHSYARMAVQRRTEQDWLKHAHFHLGQWPTIEIQALGRDRNWWEIASTETPPLLAKYYPLETAEWTQWQQRGATSFAGEWRLLGHQPGKGRYQGLAAIQDQGEDQYQVSLSLTFEDGTTEVGDGHAIVYTGFEWRARLTQGGQAVLQVFALAEDGNTLSGRWFLENSDAIGGDMTLTRIDGSAPRVLAVHPPYVKAGSTSTLAIHGIGLSGDVVLGDGLTVESVVSADDKTAVVEASAAADTPTGARTVMVGDATGEAGLTVYSQIDAIRVEPAEAIARVGGDGGPLPPVPAQFDAVAYTAGPDATPGTEDDLRIGIVPAAWSVENFGEVAAEMQDTQFAGAMGEAGLFMPAAAGPNPERRFSTNNAGNLSVKATVQDGDRTVEGGGHLVVTVQRWNDPPIR